jgi:hypothetical protein
MNHLHLDDSFHREPMTLASLRGHVTRLHEMLSDPKAGSRPWQDEVGRRMNDLLWSWLAWFPKIEPESEPEPVGGSFGQMISMQIQRSRYDNALHFLEMYGCVHGMPIPFESVAALLTRYAKGWEDRYNHMSQASEQMRQVGFKVMQMLVIPDEVFKFAEVLRSDAERVTGTGAELCKFCLRPKNGKVDHIACGSTCKEKV